MLWVVPARRGSGWVLCLTCRGCCWRLSQVIADFDRTLTKCFVRKGKKTGMLLSACTPDSLFHHVALFRQARSECARSFGAVHSSVTQLPPQSKGTV